MLSARVCVCVKIIRLIIIRPAILITDQYIYSYIVSQKRYLAIHLHRNGVFTLSAFVAFLHVSIHHARLVNHIYIHTLRLPANAAIWKTTAFQKLQGAKVNI